MTLIGCSGWGRQGRCCQRWWWCRNLPVRERFLFEGFKHTVNGNSRVPETLSEEILINMHAPPKPNYRIATPGTLTSFDAFLLGIPTRYGIMPAQWKVCPRLQLHAWLIWFSNRPSGMQLVVSGLVENSLASMLASLFQAILQSGDKKLLL